MKRLLLLFVLGVTAPVYAQNPVSIAQVGTTPVTTAVPVSQSGTWLMTQTGTWTMRLFDGSGNSVSSTGNALDINIKSSSISLTVAQATGTNLHVVCDSGCSSSSAPADASTFTFSTTSQTPVGGVFQTTATNNALTTGQMGAFQVTAQRALFTNLRNASGTEMGTSSNPLQVTGANGTFPVTGTFWQATQPVSGTVTANMGTVTADPFGANADAASATGSISAKLRFIAATGIPVTSLPADATVNVDKWNGAAIASPDAQNFPIVAKAATATTAAGTSTCYLTSAVGVNNTNCKASAGNLYEIHVTNTTTTNYFLRLYNLATAPTCSSSTGFVETIPALGASANGGINGRLMDPPQAFSTGIGFCLTGGGSSTDNTNAATGVYITLLYK